MILTEEQQRSIIKWCLDADNINDLIQGRREFYDISEEQYPELRRTIEGFIDAFKEGVLATVKPSRSELAPTKRVAIYYTAVRAIYGGTALERTRGNFPDLHIDKADPRWFEKLRREAEDLLNCSVAGSQSKYALSIANIFYLDPK